MFRCCRNFYKLYAAHGAAFVAAMRPDMRTKYITIRLLSAATTKAVGCINTHTHNRFTAGLEYVRVHPGQQVPER